MEHEFDLKLALRAFAKITDLGQRIDDEYVLDGLRATTDIDGYTVQIRDHAVTLFIFFHNTHKFEFKRKLDLEHFMEKLEAVAKRAR